MLRKYVKKAAALVMASVMLAGVAVSGVPSTVKAAGAVYYVDAVGGNDSNSGTSTGTAWKTLEKVNSITFLPGDSILLKAGSTFTGTLWPKGSGTDGNPITVDMYGTGNKPIIAGGGAEAAVYLYNQEYFEIKNLEISNSVYTNNKNKGVLVRGHDYGTLNHIYLINLDVHDISGPGVWEEYSNPSVGGITFGCTGSETPTNFNGVKIEGCTVKDTNSYGILMWSSWMKRLGQDSTWPVIPAPYGQWTPSTNVVVKNNFVERPGAGGIALFTITGAKIEHNVVKDSNYKHTNAGIWWHMADDTLVQFNEVYLSRGTADGQGLDNDSGSRYSLVQYNYTHNNEGGFMLFCSDVPNSDYNHVRYNISQNDRDKIIQATGIANHHNYIYNNTIYVGAGINPLMVSIYNNWGGYPTDTRFYNNIFYSLGDKGYETNNGTVYGYNVYYGKNSVASDSHKITADPKLVNPGSGGIGINTVDGYKLQPDSPCINSGVPVTPNGGRDYWGAALYNRAPDRGACEYQGETAPPANVPDTINLASPPSDNISINKPVQASSCHNNDAAYSPAKAVDGKYQTYWSSSYSDNQWIYVDLLSKYNVSEVRLNWSHSAYAKEFKVQTSDDGVNWTDVYSTLNAPGGEMVINPSPGASGRYVRIYCVKRASQWGNSIYEFEVFGTPATGERNHAPAASISTTFPTAQNYIINDIKDGSMTSSWSTTANVTFPQYITLNLGSTAIKTGRMTLATHFGVGQGITKLDVEYFNGTAWVTAASDLAVNWSTNTGDEEYRDITYPEVTTSSIRLKVTAANRQWGNVALNELMLWGIQQ